MRWVLVLLVALTASCVSAPTGSTPVATTLPGSTTGVVPATTSPTAGVDERRWPVGTPRDLPAFDAQYRFVHLIRPDDEDRFAGPAWPESMDGVVLVESVRDALTWLPDGEERLLADGMVVQPVGFEQFHTIYEWASYDGRPQFVTTDTALHFWHLVFAKVLRETEQQRLLPALEGLLVGGLERSRAQDTELSGTTLADAASRAMQFYEAAAVLAGLDVGTVGPLAQREIELAREHAGIDVSPIASSLSECMPQVSIAGCVDYSLFTPRGHYTRNADLERYFVSMSLLGQTGFSLVSQSDPHEPLRRALLTGRPIIRDAQLLDLWTQIYEPTSFLVGAADDFTVVEAAAAAQGVVPGWLDDPTLLTDEAVGDISAALVASRDVSIDPEAATVRVMSTRAVLDSFILDQLGFPNVGTQLRRRVYVSSLDVASVFGSDLAARVQDEAGEHEFAGYAQAVERLRRQVAEREPSSWGGTVYDAWLSVLEAVWVEKGPAFPPFMRSPAWAIKDLQTGLGSYAELKHDTILYAKQAFMAEGEGPPPPPAPPRHWVEPNPVVFLRLSEAAGLLLRGLDARGLLPHEESELVSDLIAMLDRFAAIAVDELAGKPISELDNAWLGDIGEELELMWLRTAAVDPALGEVSEADQNSALVADIARTSDWILEVGTGGADLVFVLVPDDSGTFQVATGAIFSFYEFWSDTRLTDAEWQDMISMGEQPDRSVPLELPDGRIRPAWIAPLVAG